MKKPCLSRAIIVAAGPVANFLLAMVLFAGLFVAVGRPVTLPVVGEVMPEQRRRPRRLAGRTTASSPSAVQPIGTFEDMQHDHRRPSGRELTMHHPARRRRPGPHR